MESIGSVKSVQNCTLNKHWSLPLLTSFWASVDTGMWCFVSRSLSTPGFIRFPTIPCPQTHKAVSETALGTDNIKQAQRISFPYNCILFVCNFFLANVFVTTKATIAILEMHFPLVLFPFLKGLRAYVFPQVQVIAHHCRAVKDQELRMEARRRRTKETCMLMEEMLIFMAVPERLSVFKFSE